MKKSILSTIFLSLILLVCGVFYGCGGRYDNLSMQAAFSYSLASATDIDGRDAVRVNTSGGVFDDNKDGTYTFYINENSTVSANIEVEFDGVPEDFNYNASINFTNNIGKTSGQRRYTSNGFVETVTFFNKGQTTLEVLSAEGNKKISLNIEVVQIAKSISFKTQNYALTKTDGSFIDLDRAKALKVDGSIVNIDYSFGTLLGDEFTAFSDIDLWNQGLEFDSFYNKLIVTDGSSLNLDSFVIQAVYEDPLKDAGAEVSDNHVDYTTVSVVNEIESDSFEMFLGEDSYAATSDNKITQEDLQNLIVNIPSLNYIDVVLKVKTNGEEAGFGYNTFANFPIDIFGAEDGEGVTYVDASNNVVDEVENAVYTFKHMRIVANKKTTDDDRYPNYGEFELELTCFYKNYTVEGYPLVSVLTLKNDTLIKNFSVNDVEASSIGVLDANFADSLAQNVDVYINTDSSLYGSQVKIDVAQPVGISSQNAKFKLKLYDSSKVVIEDASTQFKVYKSTGASSEKASVDGKLNEAFDKNTTFYFRAVGADLQINDYFYLEVVAELPESTDLRARAVVKLKIVEGIQTVETFEYYTRDFIKVDGNALEVEGAIYDNAKNLYYVLKDSTLADTASNRTYLETKYELTTVNYVVVEGCSYDADKTQYYLLKDALLADTEENRRYFDVDSVLVCDGGVAVTGAKYDQANKKHYILIDTTLDDTADNRIYLQTKNENIGPIEFDDATYVSNGEIAIDLTSTFDVNVVLDYLPEGAEIGNLTIESSKKSVFSIDSYVGKDAKQNTANNYFSIIPHSVGEGEVLIKASNLSQVYKIGVKVYKPITSFGVKLSSILSSYGVGDYQNDPSGDNTQAAVVKVGRSIKLNLNTMPQNATEYILDYEIYDLGAYEYASVSDLMTIHATGTLIGSYQIDYEGNGVGGGIPVIGNADFQFSCTSNTLIFPSSESSTKVYCLKITLTNLDGTTFEKSILFASYVPVESIDTSLTSSTLYNPNTLYYGSKTLDENDPSVFGIKVDVNKNSQASATFDFRECGKIEVIFNGEYDSFTITNGFIEPDARNKILIPISLSSDAQGYYWFRLNESYFASASNGVVLLNILVEEFSYTFSKPISVYVQNATRVSSLLTESEESVYFKQSITPAKTVSITVANEKAYNKELLIKVFDVKTINNVDYYVEQTDVDSVLKAIDDDENPPINFDRLNKATIKLTLDANKAGRAVVVVMPQDRVISRANFDAWNNKQYVSVDLDANTYTTNFYYTFDGSNYVLADGEYSGTENYYICSSDVFCFTSLWQDYLKFDIAVADGVIVPYQVSTVEDLKEISSSGDTVTKRYVLTNNITLDSSVNWQPIGNYYVVDFSQKNAVGDAKYVYSENVYYVYDIDREEYVLDDLGYSEDKTYYLYGFNGEISGVYSFRDIKTNTSKTKYFTISNLSYAGNYSQTSFGLISNLGVDGSVDNLSVRYNYFQPVLSSEFSFGGIAGINYGTISNSQVHFNNITFASENNLYFGGITGKNFGFVNNEDAAELPSFEGIKGEVKLTLSGNDTLVANIGGLVGYNEGEVVGAFDLSGEIVPTFNDAGFDSSVNISVVKQAGATGDFDTSIGGAVGVNYGIVSNVCVQGSVSCLDFDNVGGLVGKMLPSNLYYKANVSSATYEPNQYYIFASGVYVICDETDFDEDKTYYLTYGHHIKNSYSIAKVFGKDNVGGAIGYVAGLEGNEVEIYNISAENYSSLYNNQKRPLVTGQNNVGGLAGKVEYANINYSYAVSYYDNFKLVDNDNLSSDAKNTNNYDVVSNASNAGGFIGYASNSNINNCAASLYVLGKTSASIFVAYNYEVSTNAQNVFATGLVYSASDNYSDHLIKNLNVNIAASNFGYYSFASFDSNAASGVVNYVAYYEDGNTVNAGATDIINAYNNLDADTKENWAINSKINAGLPYLVLDINPLFATTPIEVYATVKDNNNYKAYIKYSDNAVVLFFNYDYLNGYQNYIDLISALNMFKLTDLVDIEVYAKTHKSYRLDVTTSNSKVISVDANGNLKVVGVGNVIITISSKLNSNYKAEINVVVAYGLSDVSLYSNISLTQKLVEGEELSILKNRNHALYVEGDYSRVLNEGNPNPIEASLQHNSEVGVRFKITNYYKQNGEITTLTDIINNLDNANTIDDLFKFNGISWLIDADNNYYIDVPVGTQPIINSYVAFGGSVEISYTPFITATFGAISNQIMLENYSASFEFSIKKGATKFVLENNLDNIIAISQLQTQVFTLTLYTDFEDEEIGEDYYEIAYESYTDNNLWDVINSNSVIDNEVKDFLSIVKSDVSYNLSDSGELESISINYTVTFKDKINAVEKDRIFRFYFGASSNAEVNQTIGFVILGQDKINQVYGTIYSNLADFPQTPEKNNTIYNGSVGTLSLEVYPFFSNYSRMRVYYTSSVRYPLFMTQLSYDITGASGKKLNTYPESGSVSDANQYLWIEKSSGQDTYLFNETGTYSYSKTYFISLLVSTEVPDKTNYTIYVDFLNRSNDVIETYQVSITTIAQPGIWFGFDESLKGNDDQYYLPLNTTNKIDVNLNNYEGEVEWEVSCSTLELNQNLIDVLTPYKDSKGNYYFKVMEYSAENNVFTPELLGHTLTIKGTIEDGRNAPKFAQNYYEIDVVVSLFTVVDVSVKDCVNGHLTATVSSTTPLYAKVNAYYDSALTSNEDNWYNYIMSLADSDPIKSKLVASITACGYEIEDSFINYITQLQNAISKANYNSNQNASLVKTSGVWYYKSNEPSTSSGYIQSSKDYNASTFGVEMSNGYFAVYGRQIDINSELSLRLNLAYNNGRNALEPVNGIPNVFNHNLSTTDIEYQPVFNFTKDFILSFVYKSDLINAIPISTAEEFLQMEEGFDYRLINDIELSLYSPISTAIATLDGNNYTIFISSFAYSGDYSEDAVLGLFDTIDKSTILYNVNVCYTNKVERQNGDLRSIENGLLNVNLKDSAYVAFGGLAVTNNGTLTNCSVEGAISITINEDVNYGTVGSGLNGGLVATNAQTGYITNSRVENFDMSCYSVTGGVVATNEGKIVSTYFTSSSINNLSSSTTGGFVNTNNGEIYESYVEGYRLSSDVDIRNTGAGVSSKGIIGGFVYSNANIISDCYSNISLSSSLYIAGFVYTDLQASNISRCYSISYKAKTYNPTIAAPFAGTSDESYRIITINGQLNNCFYLAGTESYRDDLTWANDAENKKATGLTLDEFATHTKFTNYDLSLVYETGEYADGSPYYFIDGYTWVIVEGKPVIVSTQIKTISQRDYEGKSKVYSSKFDIFKKSADIQSDTIELGRDKKKIMYYTDLDKPETLIYTKVVEKEASDKGTLTYTFNPAVINAAGETSQTLTIVYDATFNGEDVIEKTIVSCEYGDETKKILDVRESVLLTDEIGNTYVSRDYVSDSNFRANDTLEIICDESGEITSLQYFVLESASYFYRESADGISHAVGTRTNPQIVYDAESFNYYLAKDTVGNFYRIVKDIDFNYGFTKTSYSNFQGALQGNYMNLDKISISYQKDTSDAGVEGGLDAFGLFAKISTIEDQNYSGFKTTNISNLKLNVVEVLSNSHKYVGALAGQIEADARGDSKIRVVINNVAVAGYNGNRAFIQGKNAVGGLVGYATGPVVIKDISTSVSVNATKEMDAGSDAGTLLYDVGNKQNNSEVAYAGGVVGIFDVEKRTDPSTGKNFNANNVSVSGEISIIGGIIGSAFGLIGQNTVVNYVNTVVNNSDKTYLKAIVYAGGLVGENRGEILSSSIGYGSAESYSNVKPGESGLITNNYFYNGSTKETVVAIGGLVGFNNGGSVLHSISSVNVRNANATIAGGAIGRMVTGKLENVTSYGAVKAKSIIGGFIGTLTHYETIQNNSGYAGGALINYGDDEAIIKNCVAATNWLVSDYTYYMHLLSTENLSAVGGFIGLIARPPSASALEFIKFENCYYTNTLYIAVGSVTPEKYLDAAYISASYDSVSVAGSQANSVKILYQDNAQEVWPYSIREVYYENTALDASYSVTETLNSKYTINQKLTLVADHINAGTGSTVCVTGTELTKPLRYSFKVSSTTLSESIKSLYTYVDFETVFDGKDVSYKRDIIESYLKYYGILYQLDENSQFKAVTAYSESATSTVYYFIDNPVLTKAELISRYEPSVDDISYQNITIVEGVSVADATIDDIVLPTSIVINGIEIPNIITMTPEDRFSLSDENQTLSLSFNTNNLSTPLTLPNGSKIINVALQAKWSNDKRLYEIEFVDLKTQYDTEESPFITFNKEKSSNSVNTYTLNVSSKKVVFKNYLNNGYWVAGSNFLLNDDYSNAQKYLTNVENAEIYTWEEFRKTDDEGNYKPNGGASVIEISTAEELALIAHYVNGFDSDNDGTIDSSFDYEGETIKLTKDIDLSGKYWVPIGINPDHPFKGTFDGDRYSIKYATVNLSSLNDETEDEYVTYAGLFGYLGNGATIKNLSTKGGDIEGLYAGGIAAYAADSVTLENVSNRNAVTGYKMAAGIIAQADAGELNGCVNEAEINVVAKVAIGEGFTYIYAGGLVANVTGVINISSHTYETTDVNGNPVTVEINPANYGDIVVANNQTSYATGRRVVLSVGGIAGNGQIVIDPASNATNKGNISVTTNADRLNIGGIVGCCTEALNNVKNYGDIEVTYNNIKSAPKVDAGQAQQPAVVAAAAVSENASAYANVGGVVGYTNKTIENCGNEGKIDFSMNSSSHAFIAIGGVVGQGESPSAGNSIDKQDILSSYNSNNINVSTISPRTSIGVGGIIGFANVYAKTYVISDCYNTGDILTDSNSIIFVGGILGSALVVDDEEFSITAIVDEGAISGVLLGDDPREPHLIYVDRCLNIGYVSITAIDTSRNGLGAIAGITTNLQLNYNYYLRGSAYSGNTLYSSVSYWSSVNSGAYLALPDNAADSDSDAISSYGTPLGAREFLSSTLKTLNGTNAAGETVYNGPAGGWSVGTSGTWNQKYVTWYLSLVNNASSALWTDKQEVVYLEKGTYVVSSGEELAYLAENINAGMFETENITIKLSKSIDLSNRYWTPIGTQKYPFKGTFDGQGYTINNLTIDGASMDEDYLSLYNYGGLFGYTQNATIKNVGLESPIIQNVLYAGTIAVFANNTRIEKVYTDCEGNEENVGIIVDGKVDGMYESNNIGAGGLVYSLTNSTPTEDTDVLSGIYYSYNNVPVSYADSISPVIGGLVGTMSNSLISNSYNNSNGKVPEGQNHIVGQADSEEHCVLNIVFNLADYISGTTADDTLYEIINNGGTIECSPYNNGTRPTYENMFSISGEDANFESIWTKEYTLNDSDHPDIPSLRGLGKEWKNTESEALSNYDYSVDDSLGIDTISTVEETIVNDKALTQKGHVKIVNPTPIYLSQTTDRKVYLIETAEELAWLATNVNNGSLATVNCQFVLLNDINLENRYWTPIGVSPVYSFQGIFNFNGHTISNLVIDADNLAYAGLFGYTTGAYITNGYIKNAFVKTSNTDDKTNLFAGTIVGKAYNTSITNIRVSTTVVAHSNAGAFVGGIVGSLTGTSGYQISNVYVENSENNSVDFSKYNNCVFDAPDKDATEIKPNNPPEFGIGAFSTGGNVYVGGVVGYILGYSSEDKITLETATSKINVVGVNLSNASNVYIGGIAGYALEEVTVNLVKSNGLIKAYSQQYDLVGGIVGYMYNSSLTNAYFDGYVECTFDTHILSYVGGIVGSMETEGHIANVVNNGRIFTIDISISEEYRTAIVGGIIGRTLDHLFTDDGPGVVSDPRVSGFEHPIGIVEFLSFEPNDEIKQNIEEDIEKKFEDSNSFATLEENKGSECWNGQTLNLSHTYLTGGGTSFSYEGTQLSKTAVLINLSNPKLITTTDNTDGNKSMKIVYVDSDYNYKCKVIDLGLGVDSYGLNDALTDEMEDIIYIYVTLIDDPAAAAPAT